MITKKRHTVSIIVAWKKLVGVAILLLLGATLLAPIAFKSPNDANAQAGRPTSLFFARTSTNPSPTTTLTLSPNEEVTIYLFLNTQGNVVNSFDTTLTFQNALPLVGVTEGNEVTSKFDDSLFNDTDYQSNTLRYSRVNTNTNRAIRGPSVYLATLTFRAQAPPPAPTPPTTGAIAITAAAITSPASTDFLQLSLPTLSYTVAPPTPTPTRTPTPSPTPTIMPTPTGPTISLSLALSGIGLGQQRNGSPKTPTRTVSLFLYDGNDRLVIVNKPITGDVIYQSGDGRFHGTVPLGTSIPQGNYTIKVKTPRYLIRRIPGILTIPPQRQSEITVPELVVGDIDGNNVMDIRDYDIFRSCFGSNATSAACGSNKDLADLNDDGVVDESRDYRLLVEEGFQKQKGD